MLNLRIERELRGISLEELSRATKISVSQLRHIEDSNKLPTGLVAKGHLKAYINFLGLDSDQVMLKLDYQHRIHKKEITNKTNATSRNKPYPVLGFFMVLALLLVWFSFPRKFFHMENFYDEKSVLTSYFEEDAEIFHTALCNWSNQEVSIDQHNQEAEPDLIVNATLPITMICNSPTWLRWKYVTEGREVLESIFSGDKRIWTVRNQIILEIGNSNAITLFEGNKVKHLPRDKSIILYFQPNTKSSIIDRSSDLRRAKNG